MKISAIITLCLTVCFLAGCPSHKTAAPPADAVPPIADLRVTDGAGNEVLAITKIHGAYQVADASAVVGCVTETDAGVTISGPDGAQAGAVTRKDRDYLLTDAAGKAQGAMLKREGGFNVEDAAHAPLFRIRPKLYGYVTCDDIGNELAQGREKAGALTILDAREKIRYRVTGAPYAKATGILLAPTFTPLQQAAFMVAVSKIPAK